MFLFSKGEGFFCVYPVVLVEVVGRKIYLGLFREFTKTLIFFYYLLAFIILMLQLYIS